MDYSNKSLPWQQIFYKGHEAFVGLSLVWGLVPRMEGRLKKGIMAVS